MLINETQSWDERENPQICNTLLNKPKDEVTDHGSQALL